MNKTIIFDMDGTLVNLYGVDNWLAKIRNYDSSPYIVAEPLYSPKLLNFLLQDLKRKGYRLEISTWLARKTNRAYDKQVKKAKRRWLAQKSLIHLFDCINYLPYGTSKLKPNSIIVDDSQEVLKEYVKANQMAINANGNIIKALQELLNSSY